MICQEQNVGHNIETTIIKVVMILISVVNNSNNNCSKNRSLMSALVEKSLVGGGKGASGVRIDQSLKTISLKDDISIE